MTHIKLAIILVSVLAFVASINGCNTLAISGPKKYKVDLQNHMLNVTDEIETEGLVTDRTLGRFEAFLIKHEPEFGKKGSWTRAKQALDEIKAGKAATDPTATFMHNNAAKVVIKQCQDLLITEVKD